MKKGIEWLKEEIEEDIKSWGGGNPDYFRGASDAYENVKDWLNQLDDSEVLSLEFINEKAVEVYADTADAEVHVVFRMRDLQNLLVPKQELPVIPKFVADWIEECGGYYKPSFLALGYDLYSENITYPEVDKWIADNQELFARAWLDGFTVEEEQKYYAKVKGWGTNGNDGHVYYSGKFPLSLTMPTESVVHTKDEWRNYGVYEGNADFVKVEELEE